MYIIYINEAHAADVWNIGMSAGTINYSHKAITDRIKYAEKMRQMYNVTVPIYCDSMDNTAETYFSAWPVRYYIMSPHMINGKLQNVIDFVSYPEDAQFDVPEIFSFVDKNY